jgi:hypothetical protein
MAFRQLPTTLRRIGFELDAPTDMTVEPTKSGGARVQGPAGEIDIEVFQAALVIDRDGILEEKIRTAVDAVVAAEPGARVLETIPVELAGASGYRCDVELMRPPGTPRPERPYVLVFALAPSDLGVDGGVLVSVRCATAEWPVTDHILASLRILTRRSATANE